MDELTEYIANWINNKIGARDISPIDIKDAITEYEKDYLVWVNVE